MEKRKTRLKLYLPNREFLIPYIERELPEAEIVGTDFDSLVAVISPDEEIPDEIAENATILVCPNIVGTGMTGLPMTIAEKIARGTFFHVKDSTARLSTIHAVDVAQAIALSMGKPGKYIVTDGQNPTYHDFAEALAWRIKQKRIATPKQLLARILLGNSLYNTLTRDNIIDGSEFAQQFDFKPVSVTEYLRTHNYDDESL